MESHFKYDSKVVLVLISLALMTTGGIQLYRVLFLLVCTLNLTELSIQQVIT